MFRYLKQQKEEYQKINSQLKKLVESASQIESTLKNLQENLFPSEKTYSIDELCHLYNYRRTNLKRFLKLRKIPLQTNGTIKIGDWEEFYQAQQERIKKRYLNGVDAACFLSLDFTNFYRKIKQGELKLTKKPQGKKIFYSRKELERYKKN